jgi:hypothetical protein
MGNMFEAPDENAWGNPFRDDYFERIAGLGFDHVRIPITWDVPDRALQTAPFTLNPDFLQRITYVVDKARSAGLLVIINMHHHDQLFDNPENAKARFLSQWKQISTAFKSYDENLLFEVLNEPHRNLTPDLWNSYFREALDVIREDNPERAVLLGVALYGGLAGLPQLQVPEDSNLILTIHYYEPFSFTHQGAEWVQNSDPWLGTVWKNTDLDQESLKSQFVYLKTFSREKNIPVHIGEFGAYGKADLESRVLWTSFLARWFEEQGFSWAYWEFSAGFGFFNPLTNQYNVPLVDALLRNPLPAPIQTERRILYESDFSQTLGGWNLQVNQPAEASMDRTGGDLNIAVTKASAEGWHVQLSLGNIPLERGKNYLVSITGKSDRDVTITSYLGMSVSPWSSYSGYTGLSFTDDNKDYIYTFSMTSPSDQKARFVFDLGSAESRISLRSVRIEELVSGEQVLSASTQKEPVIYPNPVREVLFMEGFENGETLLLIDLKGVLLKKVGQSEIRQGFIEVSDLYPGKYFLKSASGRTYPLIVR